MILRKEDLTDNAIFLGLWNSLCDLAGVEPGEIDADLEIEIMEAKKL